MRVIRTLARLYVNDMDSALPFYENLLGTKATGRFRFPAMKVEMAAIGDLILIAGTEDALKRVQAVDATFEVDSLEEWKAHLEQAGARIVLGPKQVPTGANMIVRHPDGAVIEYVERA